MNPKKTVFSLNFDINKQPGHQTRFLSMDGFLGNAKINEDDTKKCNVLSDRRDLRKVFKSGQVPELLPSFFTKVTRGK